MFMQRLAGNMYHILMKLSVINHKVGFYRFALLCTGYLFLLALSSPHSLAQEKITGIIYDSVTKETIPFATVKFGSGVQGTVADLDGKFTFAIEHTNIRFSYLEVSCLGYHSKTVSLPLSNNQIYLQPEFNQLQDVIIIPPYDKIRRIVRAAIAKKTDNNPDKYDWYKCHVYYKMVANISLPDSFMKDTSKDKREFRKFSDSQHLLMSETYSIRTWRKPQQLQEDVIASRFSGLKKSVFTSLVTDVVPFHAYSDYLTLNGKDYHNPVSHGFEQYYQFSLDDEIIQGEDTVWALSFKPRGRTSNELEGKVFINSDGYAISHIIAKNRDTMLKMSVRIEQEYAQLAVNDSEKRWFPKHMNYIIDWERASKKSAFTLHMKGTSEIDSVKWLEDPDFRFDKSHTVKLKTSADELPDSQWNKTRPDPLDAKEANTYKVLDSLGSKFHADRFAEYMSKLPEGKIQLSFIDFDITRFFTYNYHENCRLGAGAQTNEKLVKWLSAGGWAGYGFGDLKWKYGGFLEAYGDKHKEFVFRIGYTDDINDPGRVRLNHDLDKNYLNSYLLTRVDEMKTTYVSVKKKFGYWSTELSARQQQIVPQYQYALETGGNEYSQFKASEASLSLRYAYAERTAPLFNYYYTLGSLYPMWYAKITSGMLQTGNMQTPYTQVLSAVAWRKHINRIGNEHILFEGGKSWSNNPLPLSKLFAGSGNKFDVSGSIQSSVYSFGGLMTAYPYQFYSDQFLFFLYRHDFDWKLYKLENKEMILSSAPNLCVQYNMLYGTLNNPGAQKYVNFSVPDKAYNEAGLLLNNLVRVRYYDLYYLTLNIGYFYHIIPYPIFDGRQNGRLVYGAGFDL